MKRKCQKKIFFLKLNEITEKEKFFNWNDRDNYFSGKITQNTFNLFIELKDNNSETNKLSLHNINIVGEFQSGKIFLKSGHGFRYYINFFTTIALCLMFYSIETSFSFPIKLIFLLFIFGVLLYRVVYDYIYSEKGFLEIERKFIELSNAKLCKKKSS